MRGLTISSQSLEYSEVGQWLPVTAIDFTPESLPPCLPLSLYLSRFFSCFLSLMGHKHTPAFQLPSPRSHTEPAGVQPHPMESQYSNRHIRMYAPPNPGTDVCSHDCMAKTRRERWFSPCGEKQLNLIFFCSVGLLCLLNVLGLPTVSQSINPSLYDIKAI